MQFEEFEPRVVLDMIPQCAADAQAVVHALDGIADRLVAISSQDVYRAYGRLIGTEPGPPDPVPLTEEAPLRERLYPYRGDSPRAEDDPKRWMDDYDKIPMERVVLNNDALVGTVLRLPAVYGPGDGQHRVYQYLEKMDAGQDEIILNEALAGWRWTRGYVENVAAAIAVAVVNERARGRVFNVGEAHALTTTEWIKAIGCAAGWHGEVVTAPAEDLPPELSTGMVTAQDLVADTSRLWEELGFTEPVNFSEGLWRTVSWERSDARARDGDNPDEEQEQ